MKICTATSAPFSCWGAQLSQFDLEFQKLGHETVLLSEQNIASFDVVDCDILFMLGTAEPLDAILSKVKAKKRVIYILESFPTLFEADAFVNSKLATLQPYLDYFDYFFITTSRNRPILEKLGHENIELLTWPHFPSIFFATDEEKRYDITFIGMQSDYRNKIIENITNRFNNVFAGNVYQQDMVNTINQSKIILNIHYTPLINFECRVSEVLGCRGFLMSEKLEPANIISNGVHFIEFDADNVVNKIEHYLANEKERLAIAKNGFLKISEYNVGIQARKILDRIAG